MRRDVCLKTLSLRDAVEMADIRRSFNILLKHA